ncbi:MAG: hypothetical protein R3F46_00185 [bacterium]
MDKAATTAGTQKRRQFGTFAGVYTPSILTILGAIMFMRANFVTERGRDHRRALHPAAAKAVSVLQRDQRLGDRHQR